MPRPVGYGRPDTPVFPPGWQDTHGRVIEATFDCTVQIGGMTSRWSEEDQETVTTIADPVYDGPASVSVVSDTTRLVDAADDQVPTRDYLVTLPVDTAGIETETHVVKVTDSPDVMLTDRTLSIDGVVVGGRRFCRILRATLND